MTASFGTEVGAVLREALAVTAGDRQSRYGHPSVNLGERTAALMQAYVSNMPNPDRWSATDVCNLMILLKVARLQESPTDFDSLVDIAGYASAAWEAAKGA